MPLRRKHTFLKKKLSRLSRFLKSKFGLKKFLGFTLVELLVVVGILGTLSGVTLTSVNIKRNYEITQDSVRKSNLNLLHQAFAQYYLENRCIPPYEIWQNVTCDGPVPPELVPYLSTIPCDPETGDKYYYEPLDNQCRQCNSGCGVCVGFRILTLLRHPANDPPPGAGCAKDVGCGVHTPNGKPYNYGVAMVPSCVIPLPTPTPTNLPTSTPPPTQMPTPTITPTPTPTPTPSPTPTHILSPVTDITVTGRLINEFTGTPIFGANFYSANLNPLPSPTYSDANGRFTVSTGVTHLVSPSHSGAWAIYTPSCYFYAVGIGVTRYQDWVSQPDGVQVYYNSHVYRNDTYYPLITSTAESHLDVGDLSVRPATNVIINSDIEVRYFTEAQTPEYFLGNGNMNYRYYHSDSSRIIPFGVPMRIILTDRNNTNYYSPYFTADMAIGCASRIHITFIQGSFTVTQQ